MNVAKNSAFKSKKWILRFVNSIPNYRITSFFRGVYDGQCYAGNPKRKTNTRVSIIIPEDIAKDNLKFMRDWAFLIIGIYYGKEGKEGDIK